MMILRSTQELVVPTLKKWEILKFHNNETKSRMNIEIANKKLIHKFNYAIDEMMLNALISYENLNSFVIFGKDKVNAFNLYNELFKDNYILYGIKTIELNKQDVIKMLYQFIFPRMIIKSKNDLIEYIGTKYPYIAGFNNNSELINISTLILCKRSINDSYPSKDISRPEYCIYIPKTGEEKNICATVIFCQSTIDFIKLQNFDYFLTKENEKSKKMFLKYKNWLYNNVPLEKQCSFMLFSSIVLYLIGNREMNDLDLYIDNVEPEIAEKVKQFDEDETYKYIEYKLKGSENIKYWPLHWHSWLDDWARRSGAKYFEEVVSCQRFHFYFLGVKVISLNCDIQRRVARNRPRATADLIALRKRYVIPKFPKIPIPESLKYEFQSVIDKSENEIRELIRNGAEYIEENKEVKITLKNDIDKFLNTVIWALKERYKMIFTVDEVRYELNMPLLNNNNILQRKKIIVRKNDAIVDETQVPILRNVGEILQQNNVEESAPKKIIIKVKK
jgi:hypothetical protein